MVNDHSDSETTKKEGRNTLTMKLHLTDYITSDYYEGLSPAVGRNL